MVPLSGLVTPALSTGPYSVFKMFSVLWEKDSAQRVVNLYTVTYVKHIEEALLNSYFHHSLKMQNFN